MSSPRQTDLVTYHLYLYFAKGYKKTLFHTISSLGKATLNLRRQVRFAPNSQVQSPIREGEKRGLISSTATGNRGYRLFRYTKILKIY